MAIGRQGTQEGGQGCESRVSLRIAPSVPSRRDYCPECYKVPSSCVAVPAEMTTRTAGSVRRYAGEAHEYTSILFQASTMSPTRFDDWRMVWRAGSDFTWPSQPRWQHYPPRTRPDRRRPTCRGSRSPRGRRTFTTSSNRFRRGTPRSSASASGVSAPPLKCLRRSYLLTAQRARGEE